ncbi:MAG: cyclic pyranopterin monophosphate synthase MoaC [Gemmatimonadales bacterium]|nr:cyclic pyranopterin monophosphate synthase MoaC [Gemmatimonadales bacterium]
MVDVSAKEPTLREARAEAMVKLGPELLASILDADVAKGDVLGVARLAGINAVKRTSDLIPLSHPLSIHYAAVDFENQAETGRIRVQCTVKALEKTGVEMEAMTGAAVAALTIYDMCKGQDKSIAIEGVRLVFKSGGKSGLYQVDEEVGK